MTEEEKTKILGKPVTPELYYRLDDYKYLDNPKDRVLSRYTRIGLLYKGIRNGLYHNMDRFYKCRKDNSYDNASKKDNRSTEKEYFSLMESKPKKTSRTICIYNQ